MVSRPWVAGTAAFLVAASLGAALTWWQSSISWARHAASVDSAQQAALARIETARAREMALLARQLATDRAFVAYVGQALQPGLDDTSFDTTSVRDLLIERRDELGFGMALVLGPGGRVLVDTTGGSDGYENLAKSDVVARSLSEQQPATGYLVRRGRLYWGATAPLSFDAASQGFLVIASPVASAEALELAEASRSDAAFVVVGGAAPQIVAASTELDAWQQPARTLAASMSEAPAGKITLASDRATATLAHPLGASREAWLLARPAPDPWSERLGEHRRVLLAGIVGAAVGFALLVAWMMRNINAPLATLTQHAEAASRGEPTRMPARGRDGFGRVGRVINGLVHELGERREGEKYATEAWRQRPRRDLPAATTGAAPFGEAAGAFAAGLGQRYEVRGVLGESRASVVHYAIDRGTGDVVALRAFKHNAPDDSLRNELRQAARIADPKLASITEVGQVRSVSYVVSEFVRGVTLADAIERGVPSLDAGLHIARQLVGAVAAAHQGRVIHRAINPRNVVLEPGGRLRLLDLGATLPLAFDGAGEPELESAAAVRYLAPEQLRTGESIDARADVYAIGLVLAQLFTGTYPYPGSTAAELRTAHLRLRASLPERATRLLPPALHELILRCLDKDPAARPADAEALGVALAACRQDAP